MQYILLFIIKYILGYLLQDIVILLGVYTFSKQRIDRRSFCLILSLLVPTNIIVRLLPISNGINILINVGLILFATYKFCHFELYKIIRSTLFSTLLVLVNEILCFASLLLLFGQAKADHILQIPLYKAAFYVPFNIALSIIFLLCYRRMLRKKQLEGEIAWKN